MGFAGGIWSAGGGMWMAVDWWGGGLVWMRTDALDADAHSVTNPIDLDRQCGVINDKNLPCSRSLTCKTHTVGAKRAVEGRTRPYDLLYLEWQRANNPNFKEPPTKKDKDARKAEKRKRKRGEHLGVNESGGPDGAGAAGGQGGSGGHGGAAGGASVKKKKGTKKWGDDEGLMEEGVDGQRELEELIHVARIAGERVGARPSGSKASASWWGVIGIGAGGVGSSGGAGDGLDGVGNTSMWRAATFEFAQVGDMLTKALAARSKPPPAGSMVNNQTNGVVPPPKSGVTQGAMSGRMGLMSSGSVVGGEQMPTPPVFGMVTVG